MSGEISSLESPYKHETKSLSNPWKRIGNKDALQASSCIPHSLSQRAWATHDETRSGSMSALTRRLRVLADKESSGGLSLLP
jgi:hypothetical protein